MTRNISEKVIHLRKFFEVVYRAFYNQKTFSIIFLSFVITILLFRYMNTRFNHLRDNVVQLRGIFTCYNRTAKLQFQIPAGVSGY